VRPFGKASDRCSVTLGSMPANDDRCSTFWADGEPDLVIGYSESNASTLLRFLLSKVDEIGFQVGSRDGR
jgi:hypothetical protein